jgi:hypothetical protein
MDPGKRGAAVARVAAILLAVPEMQNRSGGPLVKQQLFLTILAATADPSRL